MVKRNLTHVLLLCIVLFYSTISTGSSKKANKEPFSVWLHSDMQLINSTQQNYYISALKDISTNYKGISMAIVAGDIVQDSNKKNLYPWYVMQKKKSGISFWYEIAGNHEAKNLTHYKKYITKRMFYSIRKGNILFLFMSNELHSRRTHIGDTTFKWWEKMVKNNQDKIIITITHASLKGSGLLASSLERQQIVNSKRFTEVLKKYRVDFWFSGHSHFPGWLMKSWKRNKGLNNIVFCDLGAIRKDFLSPVESRILQFTPGSNNAILIYRNHSSKKNTRKLNIKLPRTFYLNKN